MISIFDPIEFICKDSDNDLNAAFDAQYDNSFPFDTLPAIELILIIIPLVYIYCQSVLIMIITRSH